MFETSAREFVAWEDEMLGRSRIVTVGFSVFALLLFAGSVWVSTVVFTPPPGNLDSAARTPNSGEQANAVLGERETDPTNPERVDREEPRHVQPATLQHEEGLPPQGEESAPQTEQAVVEPPRESRGARQPSEVVLHGRVVSPGGEPVAEARVRGVRELFSAPLRRQQQRPQDTSVAETTTAEDGTFRFATEAWFARDGYVVVEPPPPYTYTAEPVAAEFEEEHEEGETLEIALGEIQVFLGAAVQGRVTDTSGAPLAGVGVLQGQRHQDEHRNDTLWLNGPRAKTDAEGRYHLAGLEPGRDAVSALAAGYLSAAHLDVSLEAGRTTSLPDLVLERGPSVEVRVSDGEVPLAGARVRVRSAAAEVRRRDGDEPLMTEAQTNVTGRVRLDELILFERFAMFEASKPGYRGTRKIADLPGNEVTLRLRLERDTQVSYRPVDAHTGKPALRERGDLYTSPSHVRFDRMFVQRQSSHLRVEQGGVVVLGGLEPGEQTLHIGARMYVPTTRTVNIEAGEHLDLGDIPLTPARPLRIFVGDNDDGRPIPDALVRIRFLEAKRASRALQTNNDGWVETGLEFEGASRLHVEVNHEDYLAAIKTLQVRDDDREAVLARLALERGSVITGTVFDVEDEPIPRRIVVLRGTDAAGRVHETSQRTDLDGRFSFRGLRAGRYRVQLVSVRGARRDGAVTTTPERHGSDGWFELEADETFERDLYLPRERKPVDVAVRGNLFYDHGGIAANLPVEMIVRRHAHDEVAGTARTDAYGRFEIHPHWRVRGAVRLRVHVEVDRTLTLTTTVDAERSLGRIQLPPLLPHTRGSLRLRVVQPRTGAPASGTVEVQRTTRGNEESNHEHVHRTVHVHGEQLVDDLPQGEYELTMKGDDDTARIRHRVTVNAGSEHERTFPLYRNAPITFRFVFPESDDEVSLLRGLGTRITTRCAAGTFEGPRTQQPGNEITLTGLCAGHEMIATISVRNYPAKDVRFTAVAGYAKVVDVTFD